MVLCPECETDLDVDPEEVDEGAEAERVALHPRGYVPDRFLHVAGELRIERVVHLAPVVRAAAHTRVAAADGTISRAEHKALKDSVEEIQADLQSKVNALQATQKKLGQKEDEVGQLEAHHVAGDERRFRSRQSARPLRRLPVRYSSSENYDSVPRAEAPDEDLPPNRCRYSA